MLRCIAIDDEPLALRLVTDYIGKVPFLHLMAGCGDAFEAAKVMQEQEVDLMFMDIQMPGLTGLQFIQSLVRRPMVILVTAYRKFAPDGFDLDVVDYLIKPVGMDRFLKACYKAQELHQLRTAASFAGSPASAGAPGSASAPSSPNSPEGLPPSSPASAALSPGSDNPAPGSSSSPAGSADSAPGSSPSPAGSGTFSADFFFVNVDYSLVKIIFADIIWIESSGDYQKIHLRSAPRPLLVRASAKAMEAELPRDKFIRIHKSCILSIESITAVRKNSVFIGELELPVGETYRDAVRQLTGKNL